MNEKKMPPSRPASKMSGTLGAVGLRGVCGGFTTLNRYLNAARAVSSSRRAASTRMSSS